MWWSYVLMFFGVVGLYLIGKKIKAGWYINIVAQVLWFIYAIATKQYGFLVSSVAYAATYYNGLRNFGKIKFAQTKEQNRCPSIAPWPDDNGGKVQCEVEDDGHDYHGGNGWTWHDTKRRT